MGMGIEQPLPKDKKGRPTSFVEEKVARYLHCSTKETRWFDV